MGIPRTVLGLALLLGCLFLNCSGDKGTGPSTGIAGMWPAEAVGRYVRTHEYQICPFNPLACQYRLYATDTVDVCGDLTDDFVNEFLEGWSFPPPEVSGEISDSLYYIYEVFASTDDCFFYLTISTEKTHRPPSRDGWQFTVVFDTDCGEWYPGTNRFTYTRIGDVDCPSDGS